ncbi:membrane protein [Clostridium acetobutylicum]|nr:membrane protein [Clostridium acetobutylicum]
MELNLIFKTIILFLAGTFVLRIAGRKSISQMTMSQTIVMISLGALLVGPIVSKSLIVTVLIGCLLGILMIIIEYIQMKSDFLENLFTGKSVMVVENGKVNLVKLRKLRMSLDKLEMRLREAGISSIEDLKYATIEINGQLGYELKDEKKPLTKEDFNLMMSEISNMKKSLKYGINPSNLPQNDIFEEVKTHKFEGDDKEPN